MRNSLSLTRRSLLAGASLLALTSGAYAHLLMVRGGGSSGGGGGPTLLTTLTLKNTSASTQSSDFITPLFGHLFKQGDIPSGTAPQFKLTDGTVIPFSMSVQTRTHADGSLFHAAFMLRVPTSIAGSGSVAVNVYNGGTVPSASSRSLSDFAAGGLDLNVSVTGLDNLSGVWVSDLNQGVTANGADYKYVDGAAGAVWRVPAAFRQSSADHGQLMGWWYVAALQDASGNLAGFRHLTRIVQPYYNVTSVAPQFRSFTAFGVYNGATQLADMMANFPSPKTFTWSGTGPTLDATANGFEAGMACQLTTTGTLPGGLSTGQTYCTYTTSTMGANAFAVGLNFTSVIELGTSSCVTPTDAGTGTHTCTLYPMVTQWGSLWTAQTNGRWNYIQGAGSIASDSTILVQPTFTYWMATGALPPYAIETYTVSNNSTYIYYPDTAGPCLRNIGQTGESEGIAPLPAWYVRHIFTNAAIDEQAVRVIGLIGGHLPICLRDVTTKAIPVANSTNYAGMPAHNSTFRWYANASNYSGLIIPSNTNVLTQGWSYVDFSHIPGFTYYPYLLTGEPQFMDMVAEYGDIAVYSAFAGSGTAAVTGTQNTIGSCRNSSINGVTYSGGIFNGDDLLRALAWPTRDLASTQILPNTNPENPSYNAYFNDLLTAVYGGLNGYVSLLEANAAPYVTTNGLFNEAANADGGIQDSWTMGYYIGAHCLAYGLTKSSATLSFLNYLLKWPAHIYNTFGAWFVPYSQAMARVNGASCTSSGCSTPYITSDSQFAIAGFSVTWSSTTGLFTLVADANGNPVSGSYSMSNGDIFMWNGTLQGSPPSGFSDDNVPYYVVNKSGTGGLGTTFQLASSPNGTPIALTDSQPTLRNVYGIPVSEPSGYVGDFGGFSASAYLANTTAHFNWAKAIGASVDGGMLSALQMLITNSSGYVAAFEAVPKYAMQSSYPQ